MHRLSWSQWRFDRQAIRHWLKADAPRALRQFWTTGMRWSYLFVAGLVLVGALVNLLLPHGWTIWPFVGAAAIMLYVHEAAERNGQGVPPLHVYAFFVGAVTVWIIVMALLSVTNPLILLIGICGLGYYCGNAYLKQRERLRLIETRRAEGRCIHCGEIVANATLGFCENCGEEPDPIGTQLQRVASTVASARRSSHARSVLTPESASTAASRKERVLLQNRPRPSTRRK